jgi:hypothetical protein
VRAVAARFGRGRGRARRSSVLRRGAKSAWRKAAPVRLSRDVVGDARVDHDSTQVARGRAGPTARSNHRRRTRSDEHIQVLVERIATGDWQSSGDETRPRSRARRILDGLVFSGVLAAILAFAIASVYLRRDYLGVADHDVVRTGLMLGGALDMVIVLCVVWQTRTPTADGDATAVRDPGPFGDD